MIDAPEGGFAVILADPPWKLRNAGTRLAPQYQGDQRAGEAHYQVLSTKDLELLGMAVQNWAAVDAFLFLWAPNALVLDGTATGVARAWGFEPKQLIPWVKTDASGEPRLGGGNYTRVVTEQLILCRRGKAKVLRRDVPGVLHAPRRGHSAKPAAAYALIEKLCAGPFLELFARTRWSPSWTVWGDEAPQPKEARA